MSEKDRINLVVTTRTKQRLIHLQERMDSATLSEVIRRAVELLDTVTDNQANGGTMSLKSTDGTETSVKVLF